MTVIEFAGISDFIGCDQKYENSYSEVLRFIRERMTFRVYTSVRDKFYPQIRNYAPNMIQKRK